MIGRWQPLQDCDTENEAAAKVNYLNGGNGCFYILTDGKTSVITAEFSRIEADAKNSKLKEETGGVWSWCPL